MSPETIRLNAQTLWDNPFSTLDINENNQLVVLTNFKAFWFLIKDFFGGGSKTVEVAKVINDTLVAMQKKVTNGDKDVFIDGGDQNFRFSDRHCSFGSLKDYRFSYHYAKVAEKILILINKDSSKHPIYGDLKGILETLSFNMSPGKHRTYSIHREPPSIVDKELSCLVGRRLSITEPKK